jgi:hypothetical protein
MRILRVSISILLLVLMTFTAVPKEVIHGLYGHEDTIEQEYLTKAPMHIEPVHHHCEMLTFTAFPFLGTYLSADHPLTGFRLPKYDRHFHSCPDKDRYNLSRFRAPPVA